MAGHATQDLDVLVAPTAANARRVAAEDVGEGWGDLTVETEHLRLAEVDLAGAEP
jgi:hypothetical protein